MSSDEILTLQLGHYSNFIGTHWWNIQESGFSYDSDVPSDINHDVLFREGATLQGQCTFTPRLLLADLKGALKCLPEQGELYALPEDSQDVASGLDVHGETVKEKNTFLQDLERGAFDSRKIYNLEEKVEVWSDFLYTRFHPRTVNVVKEYQHSADKSAFNVYPAGANLWKTPCFSEDFADKIRNYIEECNNFQGFHALFDVKDGFSGLACSCLEYLDDEYRGKAKLAFPVELDSSSRSPHDFVNMALSFEALIEHSSLFVPLSSPTRKFDYVSYNPQLLYHSSALLASALDTLTLSYRHKNLTNTLLDLCADFSRFGRKAAIMSLCLPFPLKKTDYFMNCLDNWNGPLVHSLHSDCEINWDKNIHLLALRGIPESRLKKPLQLAKEERDMQGYRMNNLKEMLQFYMSCTSHLSKSEVTVSASKMSVASPFPRILEHEDDNAVSALAGLHSGEFIASIFTILSDNLEKINWKKLHHFSREGVEGDQLSECYHRILDFRDCYVDNSYVI